MDAVLEATTDADTRRKQRRSRMIRAILAGGLVLGVGTAVTLAAWNDSEYATGSFASGAFDLEGSLDGTAYASHAVGAPAGLVFKFATGTTTNPPLSPNDVIAAPFAVRLAANTTNNADVVISTQGTTGSVANLTYEVVRVATVAACTPSAVDSTGTSLVAAGTALTTTPANTFALSKGSPITAAGAAQVLCFKVTAGGSLAQNQTGTVTWKFTATSNQS